ncbi:MAG TPA: hypothetical protein VFO56_07940 [Gaiellaceae bacterium]|nr:hypothetical protein [Gaiellaceae bacterium]
MRRLLGFVAFAAVVAAVLVAASPSGAKEGVVARVLTPIPRTAEVGSRITVVWTLYHVEAGKRVPFNASGVFVRIFGFSGRHSPRAYATQPAVGRYRAAVRVPRGGVHRVAIGLMGTSCEASGCRPSPAIFRIVGVAIR